MVKKSKRILQVVGAMNMGGAETFLMNVFRNINRDEYEFIFLCYLDGEYDYTVEINQLGGKVIRIPDTRISNPFGFVRNIRQVIVNEKIDIIHSHVDFTSGYAMMAAKISRVKKRIVHVHSTSATRSNSIIKVVWFKVLHLLIIRYSTIRFACGTDAGHFMFGDRPFDVLRNGIDVKRFIFNEDSRGQIRRQHKIKNDDMVLLHIGRFELAKNHNFLIEIFASYLRMNNSAKLILLGDGSLYNNIHNKINRLGLSENIYLLGKRVNTEDYYSASDLFIMPSLYEGLPVSLIEAQMNGLRCLVSDAIDKTVNYGTVEFCSLVKSPDEWAENIRYNVGEHQLAESELMKDYDIKEVVIRLKGAYDAE